MNHLELTAQLQQELNQAQNSAKRIERDALASFERDLKRQYSAAANTLKSALEESQTTVLREIERRNRELKTAVSGNSIELTKQLSIVKKEVAEWTPRLTIAVKWAVCLPIVATFGVCVLMIAGTWLWMPRELWNLQTGHRSGETGKTYLVIEDPTWTLCSFAVGLTKSKVVRPCKTIEQSDSSR